MSGRMFQDLQDALLRVQEAREELKALHAENARLRDVLTKAQSIAHNGWEAARMLCTVASDRRAVDAVRAKLDEMDREIETALDPKHDVLTGMRE